MLEMCFFFKSFSSKHRKHHADFLCKITKLEQNIDTEEKFEQYDKTKRKLQKIYHKYAEGVKICIKCSCYQYGEKSTKFYMGQKRCGTQYVELQKRY